MVSVDVEEGQVCPLEYDADNPLTDLHGMMRIV